MKFLFVLVVLALLFYFTIWERKKKEQIIRGKIIHIKKLQDRIIYKYSFQYKDSERIGGIIKGIGDVVCIDDFLIDRNTLEIKVNEENGLLKSFFAVPQNR